MSDVEETSSGQDDKNYCDTTEQFNEVFRGNNKFSSWEDFITLFEAFQEKTNSVFKPRSGTCVSYVNEKRVNHKIPEKFVYQTVSMICLHYGPARTNPNTKRGWKNRSSVGQNCEACVKLSYKKGFLHISDMNLVHTNHPLIKEHAEAKQRKIRPVVFNDKLDLQITKCAAKNKVFCSKSRACEDSWKATVRQLQAADTSLKHITLRMLKKRMRFLMDRFSMNCAGRKPLPHDEMGLILYELIADKEKMLTSLETPRGRGRKRKSAVSSGSGSPSPKKRGRPKKSETVVIKRDPDSDEGDNDAGQGDSFPDLDLSQVESLSESRVVTATDMASLFAYWKERDQDERQLRWQEMEMRRNELDLRRKEIELQHERFEQEREERMSLMELLKVQVKAMAAKQQQPTQVQDFALSPSSCVTREFILQKDGTLKAVMDEAQKHQL